MSKSACQCLPMFAKQKDALLLARATCGREAGVDVLGFWKAKAPGLPVLASLTGKFLGIHATSAAVEIFFSKTSRLYYENTDGASAKFNFLIV
jgi:hypothetical protein